MRPVKSSHPFRSLRASAAALFLAVSGLALRGQGTEPHPETPSTVSSEEGVPTVAGLGGWHGRAELKRDNTDKGTTEETTKTLLRVDSALWGGIFSVQVTFPDEKTNFAGSPFNPKLGDTKSRYRFAPFTAGPFAMSYFVEATFPTADPSSLGAGKYQASLGLTATTKAPLPESMRASHLLLFTSQFQQVNSVAGDPERTDINYTKVDLSLRDLWGDYWVKLALNTRVDWQQDGKTGAVGELEGGYVLNSNWKVWFMAGGLLWGEGVKGTYGTKLSLTASRTF
jgi:hypothetical protein